MSEFDELLIYLLKIGTGINGVLIIAVLRTIRKDRQTRSKKK